MPSFGSQYGGPIGAAVGQGVGMAAGALGSRADRRYQERRDALNAINDYRLFIAKMVAEDPARFLKMLGKGKRARAGSKALTVSGGLFGANVKDQGKSLWSASGDERQNYLNQIASPETYGLTQNPDGSFTYRAPDFDPAVSTKYKKHLGGYEAGGIRHGNFGEGPSAGFPTAPPRQATLPQPGFTEDWKRRRGGV